MTLKKNINCNYFSLCLLMIVSFSYWDTYAFDCTNQNSEWIFCEDFETGDLSRWDETSGMLDQYKSIIQQAGPYNDETHVIRLRVPEGQGGVGINKTFNPHEYDVLYARWYIAYEEGFDFTARNHGHGLHGGDRWKRGVAGQRPNGDDWFTAQVEYLPVSMTNPVPRNYIYTYNHGMKMDCTNIEGACWGDQIPCLISDYYCDRIPAYKVKRQPPELKHETWYCIEIMVDAGDPVQTENLANGKLNLWINETEIGPWEKLWFRTKSDIQINHFWLGLYHHEAHSKEGIKFDNIVVSTSKIGCGA